MTIGSKEHYDILEQFERNFSDYRLDREDSSLWKKGQVYQSGQTNALYKAYIVGYSFERVNYI